MIYNWVKGLLSNKPFLLGVNGPQGAGKTTLTRELCARLTQEGLRAVSVSIDDFYLTRSEQENLARGGNPFLQSRGYPGTHDIALGERVLLELKNPSPSTVQIPRYDKSAFHGKGDRAPSTTPISTPLDIIFLEGWMLGFSPAPTNNPLLKPINEALEAYGRWHRLLDGFLQLVPNDYRYVLEWRVEAEEKMKASGKPGMSREEITAYAASFLPAYELYLPQLAAHPPVSRNLLRVNIGRERLPRV